MSASPRETPSDSLLCAACLLLKKASTFLALWGLFALYKAKHRDPRPPPSPHLHFRAHATAVFDLAWPDCASTLYPASGDPTRGAKSSLSMSASGWSEGGDPRRC